MWRICLSAALAARMLLAQSEVATLSGTVTDATDAVLDKVVITATNQATNLTTSTATNENGRYFFPSLRPGIYTISATLPGFKKLLDSAVTLQVNQSARLDISLAVGDASEQVTVAADTPLLETE